VSSCGGVTGSRAEVFTSWSRGQDDEMGVVMHGGRRLIRVGLPGEHKLLQLWLSVKYD
jgi:hypothetical protein